MGRTPTKTGRPTKTRKAGKPVRAATPEETALFRATVGEVRPVNTRRQPLPGPAPPAKARFSRADEFAVLDESLSTPAGDIGLESGEELSFRRPHVSLRVLRSLRRGSYAIQDELDLHGMTAAEARAGLRSFLATAQSRRFRCVRIVHGKGLRSGPAGPVLKISVNRWLRQWDAVLAFCSAPTRDGGTGAVYVLLG